MSSLNKNLTQGDLHLIDLSNLTQAEQITLAAAQSMGVHTLKGYLREVAMLAGINKGADSVNTFTRSRAIGTEQRLKEARQKAAVAAETMASPAAIYPVQLPGVTQLQPVVTRSLVAMLAAMGAPVMSPNVRALTQDALLAAPEVSEQGFIPAAAPGLEFTLSDTRKVALILAFSNDLLALGTEDVLAFVQANLTNAANNGVDAAVIGNLITAAGTAKTDVKSAVAAFAGDIRAGAFIGNPDTLLGLRSPQETNIGPNGGTYYGLPALPVLAAPANQLLLVDVKRTAVYDGKQEIERSNQADIIMDSAPNATMTPTLHLFMESATAMRVTKFFDIKPLVAPVAITVA
ncbi:hypothetical protein [Paraburkholderia heleia]|uniref:hypothetical protein n=1 Tax=Paraburkholderia heleia TaxID=634127 RepID=UPI002AB756D4|nr:hypothetical protein [Paraburkholderia heleia]